MRCSNQTRTYFVGDIYVNRNMIAAAADTQPFGGSGLSGTGFKAGGNPSLIAMGE